MTRRIVEPNDISINFAIGMIVLLVILWFGFERHRFPGPPVSEVPSSDGR